MDVCSELRLGKGGGLSALWPALAVAVAAACADTDAERDDSAQGSPTSVACVQCRILISELWSIGDSSGPGMLNEGSAVSVNERGDAFAYYHGSGGSVLVFGEEGRFARALGSRGEGPGEYRLPAAVLPHPSGGLSVVDFLQRRATHYGADYELAATNSLPPYTFSMWSAHSTIRLADGRLLLAASSRSPELAGYPLHILTPDGSEIVRSVGADDPDGISPGTRVIAPDQHGGFWTVPQDAYRLEHWNGEGELTRVIPRSVPWFVPSEEPGRPPHEAPPSPYVMGVQDDHAGHLWVLIATASENWAPQVPATVTASGEYSSSEAQYAALFDTVIEVIDAETGELVASERVEGHRGFAGRGVLYAYGADDLEEPRYTLYRVTLASAEEEGG